MDVYIIKRLLILTTLLLVLLSSSIVIAADTSQTDVNTTASQLTNNKQLDMISLEDNGYEYNSKDSNTNSQSHNQNLGKYSDKESAVNITTESTSDNSTNPIPTSITVERKDAYALTNTTINARVSSNNSNQTINEGCVVFKINGITIGTANVTESVASITYDLSTLSAKDYTIYAKYTNGINFQSSNTTSTLRIVKRPIMMSVSNRLVYSYTNVTLTATIVDKLLNSYLSEGVIVFKINGITVGRADIINGKANLIYDVSDLSPKNYTISAIYAGTKLSYDKQVTNTLSIIKRASSMTLSEKSIYTGDDVTFVATVADKVDHSYVCEGIVTFKINGKTIGASNITNGKSYFYYNTSKLSAKTYNLSATYSGTKFLSENWANATLIIMQAPADKKGSNYMMEDYHNKSVLDYYETNYDADDSLLDIDDEDLDDVILTSNPKPAIIISPITTYQSVINVTVIILNNPNFKNSSLEFKINNTTLANALIKNNTVTIALDATGLNPGNYTLDVFYLQNDTYMGYASTNLEILVQEAFSLNQIKNAAVTLRNMYESNHIINEVTIASSKIEVQDLLALMLQVTQNINDKKSSLNVTYKHYNSPDSYNDTIKKGTLSEKEIISLASDILNYMNNQTMAPEYIKTSLGNLGYYNIIYTYAKIMDLSTTTYIPTTITVYNWQSIHPENSTDRVIYISTDNIYSKTKDLNFINQIVSKLKSIGYTAYTIGVGPNTHNTKIWSKALPDNAVQVSVFGGADAGVIYDVCTRSFMRTKANRLVYFVYNPSTAKNITNLSWLERAHDDNYSPSSFKGIANPDETLLSHGYDYIYSYDVDTIVKGIIDYIS